MNLIKESIRHNQITLTIVGMIIIYGVYALMNMPRREDPKIVINEGLVVAYYPGANAEQVEAQLTAKIEDHLFRHDEVKKSSTYTRSLDGMMIANVVLHDKVKQKDIFWNKLRQELAVAKALELPQGVIGPMVNSEFGDTEAMLISLSSEAESYTQLLEYAQQLSDEVRKISATSKLTIMGEQAQQIAVRFNSKKLAQYQLSLQQVVQVLASQNTIASAGSIESDHFNSAIHISGYYNSITELENQLVSISPEGHELRLRDIAEVSRGYIDPTKTVAVNGAKAILLAIQMNEGNNIVDYGEAVDEAIAHTAAQLPSGVHIDVVFTQPQLVKSAVNHFMVEFLIAIVAVILVIMLLLPFNIAAVAATSIPITIAITFAILNAIGVELHQVSLASLIVVLGLVVDDAIVVADNYVELLDRGVKRQVAAWRSASDLIVPIFTATITIIAAFLPIASISGVIGEFIHDLPITVSVALAVSFVVSMLLTPMLCLLYIKKGLHQQQKKQGKSMLDGMQSIYERVLAWCIKHSRSTIAFSVLTIGLAVLVFRFGVKQQFFPYAERNQFVVELHMPTGTKYAQTEAAVQQLEEAFKSDNRVTSYAAFVGQSSPRVYYNSAPTFPSEDFAQLLINTTDNKATESLSSELNERFNGYLAEGKVEVKLMMQGQPQTSPMEVRIYGDELQELKKIGEEVQAIIRSNPHSKQLKQDFNDDYFTLNVQLKNDASRLGFTTESVAKQLYIATHGADVSRIYEGKNAVGINLRMAEGERASIEALGDIYIESPITQQSVPLRQIATLAPEWFTGQIVRRNGMRCLTIGADAEGIYPSALQAEIEPQLAALRLPTGYFIEYGGEHSNKEEIMGMLQGALSLSLILIFLIILFQFKKMKKVLLIISAIPLAMLGAMLGLCITGNPFGFTAMMGVISLSGIVVRNAIILVEHADELMQQGMGARAAAIEAAKRRLRPIFLTSSSAAIGVIPMIVAGSSLWGPLASVIAFGVVWSMLMTLLTIPVMYAKAPSSSPKGEGRTTMLK
ncbi:MAG: efflux RND transporter permease subunit [Mangrovibacterium sp.]